MLLPEEVLCGNWSGYGPVYRVDVTGSTNADLLTAARNGAASKIVLVADHQTAGRGRHDRAWVDEPGRALLASILLRPSASVAGPIPLLAGMAICGAVEETSAVRLGLKWPNDVLAGPDDGHKVAGILVQSVSSGRDVSVVVGFGINLDGFPSSLTSSALDTVTAPAASLADLGARGVDRFVLLEKILECFDDELKRLERVGTGDSVDAWVERYRDRFLTIGNTVSVEVSDGSFTGLAIGVDSAGRLLVQLDSGEVRVLSAGEVIHASVG